MEKVIRDQVSDHQVEIILTDLLEIFGYDFTNYSPASVKRRVNRLYALDHFTSFAEFRNRVIDDDRYISRFIQEITVNVTEMFRDPEFYATIRQKVIPVLSTHPFIRIWHAGCSTGEEVYSMAICLKESNLLHKSLLYATDISPDVLTALDKGIFPLSMIRQYSENYHRSGGTEDFSNYYTAKYDLAKFNDDLREKMIVSTHNLVSDGSFNEFQLIICRNVLIYFNKSLQERVFTLFDASLEKLGFIGLGSKEQIKFSNIGNKYTQLDPREKIWRKMI